MPDYLEQVQRGVDHIEARLDGEIAFAEIARAAGMSQWHFQRIFRALTNETLKVYIRGRRLARALERLLNSDTRIIDVALMAGFDSQESFTRAFKKAFELTPHQYRKIGNQQQFLKKVEFDSAYLRHIHSNISLEPELIDQRALHLVGLRTQYYSVDSHKNNIAETLPPLWSQFMARIEELPGRVPGVCYGVVQPTADDSDLLEYFAAVEVPGASAADVWPAGFEVVTIPAATYARFTHRGPATQLDRTVNYIYSTWLSQSGRRLSGGPDLEYYGAGYHPTSDDSVIEYAIALC